MNLTSVKCNSDDLRQPLRQSLPTRVMTVRLTCHVSAPGDEDLPVEDTHPFHIAIDDLADAIAASLKARGVDPDTLTAVEVSEHGSLLRRQYGDMIKISPLT